MCIKITSVEPSVFFTRQPGGELRQRVVVAVENGSQAGEVSLWVRKEGMEECHVLGDLPPGVSRQEITLPDLERPAEVRFSLESGDAVLDEKVISWQPQRKWEVYLVHGSHHDLGYTDLPSNVLREHDGILDQVLDFCDATDDFPEEARFHYVAEQAWSVLHFLEHRPSRQAERLVRRMREGRIEVNAFLDNETSELCSHEEQVRLVYPAFRLKRHFGIPIRTAELNDIPGVSWGLVSVLSGCGVRYFAPGIQDYFAWGFQVHPNWDEAAVLPRDQIGAFWWQGPDGSRVLFWYGGQAIENAWLWTLDQSEQDLPEVLAKLARDGYAQDFVRIKILGGRRDNAPADIRLSLIARQWNSRWAYPRLIVSTNAQFFERFEREAGAGLRVLRGDLPNTDYPIGATSRAREVGINRLAHDTLTSAEKLASCASMVSDYAYPVEGLAESFDCSLLHDGHCTGVAHPVGPAQEAAWAQKDEFACRAAALAHDALVKSANRIADRICLPQDGLHVVVFNPLSQERRGLVRAQGSSPAPCSRPMHWQDAFDEQTAYRVQVSDPLIGRGMVSLPASLLESPFELIDLDTGKSMLYQVVPLDDPLAARPFAAHRWALGHVDAHSLEALNYDRAHLMELVFLAEGVPSLGYRAYCLAPAARPPVFETSLQVGEGWIENRFYRLELDPESGAVARLYDKILDREWVDASAPHGFNGLVVRSARSGEAFHARCISIQIGERGPLAASLVVKATAPGVPQITTEITLYDGLKQIDFANRLLKDATPLQELYFAFPFAAKKPSFRYEASNSVIEPICDQLPGTNTDAYTVQHWAAMWDEADEPAGIAWASLEAPVMELGGLWPGYVSQAHHGVTPPGYGHEFLRDPEQLTKGHIYSYIMNNNFRTNFDPSQVADALFRYSLTSFAGDWRAGRAWEFGWGASAPLEPVSIQGPQDGPLPASASFCGVDAENVQLLTLKAAEDGDGLILRLVEMEGRDANVTVTLPEFEISQAFSTNLVEENEGVLAYDRHSLRVPIRAYGLATIRCRVGHSFPQNSWFARF